MKKYIIALIITILFLSSPAFALYRVTDFIGGCADCADAIDGARFNAKTKPVYVIVTTTPEHATYPSQEFNYLWDSDAACAESVPDSIIPDTNAAGGCLMLLTPGQAATIVANSVNDTHIDWGTGADQVSAVDVPIADGGSIITGTEVETALQENRTAINLNTADSHAESHTVASHSDTTATGAELETLTNTSDASSLHNHTTANLNDTTATGANLNTLTDTSDASALHNHTTANLNDTTATGTQLDTLTDDSMADAEHRHSELSASDGAPDQVISVDADGNTSIDGAATINESGADKDFRIESDDLANQFAIDGGDNTIGVGVQNGDADYSAANGFYIIADDTVRGITENGFKVNTRNSLRPGFRMIGASLLLRDTAPESEHGAFNQQADAIETKTTYGGESTGTGTLVLRAINAKTYISSPTTSDNLQVEMLKLDFLVSSSSNDANHVITEFSGLRFVPLDTQATGTTGITTAKIIDIETLPNYGGTQTNQTGIWIDNLTNFTNNYGIVLDGDGAGSDICFGASQDSCVSNDATDNRINIDGEGLKVTGSDPVLSSCGTTPAVVGNDMAGKITIGTGATTSCTVTFATANVAAPACVISGDNTAIGYATTTSTTVLTITSSADMDSDVISYICIGL